MFKPYYQASNHPAYWITVPLSRICKKLTKYLKKLDKSIIFFDRFVKNQFSQKKFRSLSEAQYTKKSCETFHNPRPTTKNHFPFFSRSRFNIVQSNFRSVYFPKASLSHNFVFHFRTRSFRFFFVFFGFDCSFYVVCCRI